MKPLLKSGVAARSLRLVLVASVLCGAAGAAQAQGGFAELFGNMFGGGGGGDEPRASAPMPQPDWLETDRPPLTVRPHRKRHKPAFVSRGGSQRYDVASLKGVTIYTDKTLSRGDAVMTSKGLKVFAGSHSWPYTDDDFVAIADVDRMSSSMRKQLTALDDASRPELSR